MQRPEEPNYSRQSLHNPWVGGRAAWLAEYIAEPFRCVFPQQQLLWFWCRCHAGEIELVVSVTVHLTLTLTLTLSCVRFWRPPFHVIMSASNACSAAYPPSTTLR